jgi:hypothetical protein
MRESLGHRRCRFSFGCVCVSLTPYHWACASLTRNPIAYPPYVDHAFQGKRCAFVERSMRLVARPFRSLVTQPARCWIQVESTWRRAPSTLCPRCCSVLSLIQPNLKGMLDGCIKKKKKKQGTCTPTTTTASHNHDHCCCVLPHHHFRVIYTHACFASWQSRFLVSQQNTTNIVSENPLRMLSTLEDLLGTHSLKRQAIAQVNNRSLPCIGARMFHCFRPYST